ncbi:hypothetical protein [Streptomyces sp. NPDC057580]|uniref:hypothetical protein n=1 Tax=Streptomyces sp. NPDC057580 TaxID=3346173 RepID=UPI0036BA1AEA
MDRILEQPSGRGLVAIPLALIMVITVVDIHSPADVHMGPLLVIAPALTASFAGPWLTAAIGVLAVAAQVFIAVLHDGLATTNHISQITALTMLSALVAFICYMRERRGRQLSRARSVAETAQRVLLRPPPRRIGSWCGQRCRSPHGSSRMRFSAAGCGCPRSSPVGGPR